MLLQPLRTQGRRTLVRDRILCSVEAAFSWLSGLQLRELTNDDSVGWWLLLACGQRPTLRQLAKLQKQLRERSPTSIGSSGLYGYTALLRTLARMGQLPDRTKHVSAITALCRGAAPRESLAVDQDAVWCLQAAFELGAIRTLSAEVDALLNLAVRRQDVLRACQLWQLAETSASESTKSDARAFLVRWFAAVSDVQTMGLGSPRDWELAYLLSVSTALRQDDARSTFCSYLLDRQTLGRWDYESSEETEATSLVGLALMEHWLRLNPKPPHDVDPAAIWLGDHVRERSRFMSDLTYEWSRITTINSVQKKGQALEHLVRELVARDPNLRLESHNHRTQTAELDLVVQVKPPSPLRRFMRGDFLLVECRNRSMPVSAAAVRDFAGKLRSRRRLNCSAGVIITTGKVTRDAAMQILEENSRHGFVIGMVDHTSMSSALQAGQQLSNILRASLIKSAE